MRRHELIQKKNSTSDRVQYECDSCGYEFMGILSDDPAGCPKCKSKSLSYEYMNNDKKNSVSSKKYYSTQRVKDANGRKGQIGSVGSFKYEVKWDDGELTWEYEESLKKG